MSITSTSTSRPLASRVVQPAQLPLKLGQAAALGEDLRLDDLRCVERLVHQLDSELAAQLPEQLAGQRQVLVGGQTEAELSVVLEQRV